MHGALQYTGVIPLLDVFLQNSFILSAILDIYYVGNLCLAILTPLSCMIQCDKTQSLDTADWHMGSSCISHELELCQRSQITQENGQACVASIICWSQIVSVFATHKILIMKSFQSGRGTLRKNLSIEHGFPSGTRLMGILHVHLMINDLNGWVNYQISL